MCRGHEAHDVSDWHSIDNGDQTPADTAGAILGVL